MPPPYQFHIVELEVFVETVALAGTPDEMIDMHLNAEMETTSIQLDGVTSTDLNLDGAPDTSNVQLDEAATDIDLDANTIHDTKVGR